MKPQKQFKLYIDIDNDAFAPNPQDEIARILKAIADKIQNASQDTISFYQTIYDINGNDVGRYAIKNKE